MSEYSRPSAGRRQTPHDVDAEMAVLGNLMNSGQYEAWDEIADTLKQEDFYLKQHKVVFAAMARLADRAAPMDRIAVLNDLRSHDLLRDAGGEDYLEIVEASAVGWRGVRGHAEIVASLSTRRRLIHVANKILELAFKPGDLRPDDLIHSADSELVKIAHEQTRSDDPVDVTRLLTDAVTKVRERKANPGAVTGAPSGWRALDNLTSGFQEGDLVVLAARPAMGKTAMALNIAEQLALTKETKPVLFFSLEQPKEQLALRLISALAGMPMNHLRTGMFPVDNLPRVSHAIQIMNGKPLYFDDTSISTPNYIRTRARKLQHEAGGLSLIIVDYLQLMPTLGRYESRTLEISNITKQLKSIARELRVPILALSQLNRELEKRPNKRPNLSDLRESGSIEQDADLVMFIYRDEMYNSDSTSNKGCAELIIAKHRNGPIGTVKLSFVHELTKFEAVSNEDGFYVDSYDSDEAGDSGDMI